MKYWKIKDKTGSIIADSEGLGISIDKCQTGNIDSINWKNNFKNLKMLHADSGIRSGITYDLYSYNLLTEPVRGLNCETRAFPEEKENTLRFVSVFSIRDIEITKKIILTPGKPEFTMDLQIQKNGTGKDKYQICFGMAFDVLQKNNPCFVVPAAGGCKRFRPGEPSGQEINDQDGFVSFPKVVRMKENSFKCISGIDRKSLIFHGDGVKYFNFNRNSRMMYFGAYGYDRWFEKGEIYGESFTVSLSDSIENNGTESLLERKYCTGSDTVRVFFNTPEHTDTYAKIEKDGNLITESKGAGDIHLKVGNLPDGEYRVLKGYGGKNVCDAEKLIIVHNRLKELQDKALNIRKYLRSFPENRSELETLRCKGIEFKLTNAEEYMKYCELDQVSGLLKDAGRIVQAIESREPAVIPVPDQIIYKNTFAEPCGDFDYFGNGDISFSPDDGLFLDPVITINMWSKFKLEGDFCMEMDYRPVEGASGGTMIQLCGNCFNPVNDVAMMRTAAGYMPHYNFGTTCYHFSFCRGENYHTTNTRPKPRVCNFRKTGRGFYVLNRIADPVPDSGNEWFHLCFVKNKRQFLFFVNDKLVQEYFDEENQGDFLNAGFFGIRNWSRRKAYFKKLRIYK